MADSPDIIGSLADLSGAYSAILCDVWGVVHNGEWHFPAAAEALATARASKTAGCPDHQFAAPQVPMWWRR